MTPLEELLETLDQAVPPEDPPFLVAAFGQAGAGGVLVTDDDLSRLLGWLVPSECWAVGLVGGGSRVPLDPAMLGGWERRPLATRQAHLGDLEASEGKEADGGDEGRMRLCCLVGRDGAVASVLRSPDGTVVASGEAEGRVIDALRRTLGLATPAPERGTADLLAVLWIEDLLAAAERGEVGGWTQAAALHPAMRVLAGEGHDIPLEHITMIARVATAAWSWENLRLQASSEDWLSDLVPASLAEWMDEGMFSRWLLADLPPVRSACALLAKVMDPHIVAEVVAVIESTGAGDPEQDGSSSTTQAAASRIPPGECRPPATPEPVPRPRAMPRN